MKCKPTWTPGAAWEIAKREREHASKQRVRDLRRTRRVLAAFLRKCADLESQGKFEGMRETATDLEVGEYSVVEYVEELLDGADEALANALPVFYFADFSWSTSP